MRRSLRFASYGMTLVLGFGVGLYLGHEYGLTRAFALRFVETLYRVPFESILFEEGLNDAKADLIRAQLAFKDRQIAKGAPFLLGSEEETKFDYVFGYARLAAFSQLKGEPVSAADYMQKAIAYCLKGKRKDDCNAERLRDLADLIDHRRAPPANESK